MDYKNIRNSAIGIKVVGWLILLVGMIWGSGDIGAGIYNNDNSQLGGGYQIVGIALGISIGLLILGGIWDRIADDKKHEELMDKLSQVHPDRTRRRW